MLYLQLILISLWLVVCCVVGLLVCLVRWGDDNLDRYFGHAFAWGAIRIARVKVTVEGLEHLESQQPCIYVANHQSGMDMANFGTIYPRHTVLVGKKELLYIPFFGLFFKAAGNITINRSKRVSAVAALADAVEQIRRRKVSVWVFPEGTRNRTSEPMLPLKKGAFYMAVQAQVPIVPIVSSSLAEVMSWKHKHMKGGQVRVRVLLPIQTAGKGEQDVESLMNETREKMVAALRELG